MTKNHLADFQHDMCQHLLSPQLDDSSEQLLTQFKRQFTQDVKQGVSDGDGLAEARARLDIYRNNVIHSLSSAIADLYPIVKRLVGEQFFKGLATEFVRLHPPMNSALVLYGQGFVEFIEQHQACRQLPYLSDVARLEVYSHQTFHARDVDCFDPATLSAVAPEQLANLSFELVPAVHLLQSAWPVEDIWQENLKQNPQQIDIDTAGGCYLLIYRREFEVQVVNLNPHCFHFLAQLSQGQTIALAWQTTLQLAESHDGQIAQSLSEDELSPMLSYLLGLPLFCGFKIQGVTDDK
jgi:hypothetical protein